MDVVGGHLRTRMTKMDQQVASVPKVCRVCHGSTQADKEYDDILIISGKREIGVKREFSSHFHHY